MSYTIHVNNSAYTVDVPANSTLLQVLRDELGLMGVREACGIGMCGSCTVLVNGVAISSCLTLIPQAAGKHILTVEGLAKNNQLHRVQQAFIDHHAFQCSFCTPGFILMTIALLSKTPGPSEAEIHEHLAGNLCRCGSYPEILTAVRSLVRAEQPG
jgi:aerobic-type carbon monoxide dehydrogenase small subunit (CoxS/CutS family)